MKRKRTTTMMAAVMHLPLDVVSGWVPVRPATTVGEALRPTLPTTSTRIHYRRKSSSRPPSSSSSHASPPSWESALAIIPPDDAWDLLQTARYLAQDVAYTSWPPAIRLLHPFTTTLHDTALDVARMVEDYQIEPFALHMTEWSIIPHQEAMSDVWNVMERGSTPSTADSAPAGDDDDDETHKSIAQQQEEEDAKFDALVQRLERIGRLRKSRRQLRERQKQMELDGVSEYQSGHSDAKSDNSTELASSSILNAEDDEGGEEEPVDEDDPSPSNRRRYRRRADMLSDKEIRDQQQLSMMEEFNGPCVVCLEPDAESKAKLVELRELLCEALPGAQQLARFYSPSASSPLSVVPSSGASAAYAAAERQADAFRPVIPIASFATVTEAIDVARALRRDWEPLSFNVTDLHLISSFGVDLGMDGEVEEEDDSSDTAEVPIATNWDTSLLPRPPSSYHHPFGCDALVSLIGEEVAMDDDLNYEMAQMLAQKGAEGGYDEKQNPIDEQATPSASEDGKSQKTRKKRAVTQASLKSKSHVLDQDTNADHPRSQLEEWLLEEDETYDEGMVVVMGRVQMFTGEMREYVGMPASKSLGDMVKSSKMSGRNTLVPPSSHFSPRTALDSNTVRQGTTSPQRKGNA